MRILVINPNSTASMTAQIEASARRVAFPGTVIEAVTGEGTPASIEGHADEAMAVPAMLDLIRVGEARGVDAYVIACFDDPGLAAAREVARGPVVGICQAGVQVASTIANRFSIVTTLPRSVPIIEPAASAGNERAVSAFRSLDRDGNGQITEEEWSRSRTMRPAFQRLNVDLTQPMTQQRFLELFPQAIGG